MLLRHGTGAAAYRSRLFVLRRPARCTHVSLLAMRCHTAGHGVLLLPMVNSAHTGASVATTIDADWLRCSPCGSGGSVVQVVTRNTSDAVAMACHPPAGRCCAATMAPCGSNNASHCGTGTS